MTAAQTVHEFMREQRCIPAAEDVPWQTASTLWREAIEKAVEDFADPESWQELEDRLETAEHNWSRAEDEAAELRREVLELEEENAKLKKRQIKQKAATP